MKYISTNPEVRAILDRPRYFEWMEYEAEHINRQIAEANTCDNIPKPLVTPFWDNYGVHHGPHFEGYLQKQLGGKGHEVADLVDFMSKCLHVDYHRYLHHGLTSSNVIDACNHRRWRKLIGRLKIEIENIVWPAEYWSYSITGYTHGRAAYRTSLGHRMTSALTVIDDGLVLAKDRYPSSVFGGPTGKDTAGHIHRQAWQRYDYWTIWTMIAQVAATMEQLATDYRFYCSDFDVGVRGLIEGTTSSCMPGKNNATEFERIVSVCHTIKSLVCSQMMLPPQWLDRDLVHSAHEKQTIDWMWDNTFFVVERMVRLVREVKLEGKVLVNQMTSYDAFNNFVNQGMDYMKAREKAKEYPNG